MVVKQCKFTLRTDPELMKKFRYIAKYNGRSSNHELELLMRKYVKRFEDKYGKIILK